MSTPPKKAPPPPDDGSGGARLLSAVLTILALAPLGAVAGALIAYKLGKDTAPFALGGALLGALAALLSRSR